MKQIHYYILFLFTRKSDGPLDHINKQTQRIRITSLSPVQKAECSKQLLLTNGICKFTKKCWNNRERWEK